MSTCIGHILKLVQYTFLLRSAVWQDCIIFQVTKLVRLLVDRSS